MFINISTFQEKNKEEIQKPRFVRRKQEDKATNHDIFIDTQCLQKHQKKKFKASNIEPLYGAMMRGGAGGSSSEIINLAIRNAFRHMINLKGGTENLAEGNCAWESAILNITERPEIEPKVNLDPGEAKIVYLNEMQEYTEGDGHELIPDHLKIGAPEKWNKLREEKVWNIDFFGDLVMPAIARGTKKKILIFSTNENLSLPIHVVTPEKFGVASDSDVPLCLAYNGVHFESMLPIHETDVQKTKDLVQEVFNGTYNYNKEDIPKLIAPFSNSERSKRSRQINQDAYSRAKMKKKETRQADPESYSEEKIKITKKRKEARIADPKTYSEEKEKIPKQRKEARIADPKAYSEEKEKKTKQQKEARLADPKAYSEEKEKKTKQQKEARLADPKAYSDVKEKIQNARLADPKAYSEEKIKKAKQQKEARLEDPKAYSDVKEKIQNARLADPKAYSEEKIRTTKQQKESRLADPKAYSEEKIKKAKQQKEARIADPKGYSDVKEKIIQQRKKNKNIAFQSNLERDTGFDSICCICMELKSKDKTTSIVNITSDLVTEFCHKDNTTLCSDGTYKACKECRDMLKKKEKKTENSRKEVFEKSCFPKTLIDKLEIELGSGQKTSLNKLEAFILKLVIPFVRVAHCKGRVSISSSISSLQRSSWSSSRILVLN